MLSVSPLLPEEGSQNAGGPSIAPPGGSSVPMNLSSVMGVVGGATATATDVGRKFLYDGAASEDNGGGLVVFVTHQFALVVSRFNFLTKYRYLLHWNNCHVRREMLSSSVPCSHLWVAVTLLCCLRLRNAMTWWFVIAK